MAATVDELKINIGVNSGQANRQLDTLVDKLDNVRRSMENVNSTRSGGGGVNFGGVFGKSGVIGTASRHLRSFVTHAGRASKSTGSLAKSLTKLYVGFRVVRGAVSALSTSFERATNLVESYHYFETAFDKIGTQAADSFAEAGYDSADAYAKSFQKRALELNEKMSGATFDSNGYATITGQKNLGLDADTVMQYQAQYAQMADSIGMAGEASLATSKAMTMLATDWSSLRNIDFETAFEKMASGLAGQSRAVRSLGIDITQAALAQTAQNIGMTTSISKMDQATKAELRMITILQQSKIAWGDLAKTLNTPANQMRLLQQNVISMSRAFGNIFLPVLARVLPYINAVVMALQRLFQFLAKLVGADKIASNATGGLSDSFADLEDDASMDGVTDSVDGTSDALDNATKKAEKLKKTILAFDELNVLNDANTSSSAGSGSGVGGVGTGIGAGEQGLLDAALMDALSDYEKVWNEAFDSMSNKAGEFADKIAAVGRKLWSLIQAHDWVGLGQYIASGVNKAVDWIYDKVKWDNVKKNITDQVDAITGIFNSMLNNIDFNKIGATIGALFNTISNTIGLYIRKIDWPALGRSFGNFVNGIVSEVDLAGALGNLADAFNSVFTTIRTAIETIDWSALKNKLVFSINSFIRKVDLEEAAATLAFTFGTVLGTLFDAIANLDIVDLARKLAAAINKFIYSTDLRAAKSKFKDAFKNVLNGIIELINDTDWEQVGRDIADFLEHDVPWKELMEAVVAFIGKACMGIWRGLGTTFAGSVVGGIIAFKAFKTLLPFADGISTFLTGSSVSAKLTRAGSSMASKILEGIPKGNAYGAIGGALGIAATIAGLVDIGKKLGEINDEAKGGNGYITDYGKMWDYVIDKLKPQLGDAWQKLFDIKEELEDSGASAGEFATALRTGLEEAGVSIDDAGRAVAGVTGEINATTQQMSFLDAVMDGYSTTVQGVKDSLDFSDTNISVTEFKDVMTSCAWEVTQGLANAEAQEKLLQQAIQDLPEGANIEEVTKILTGKMEEWGIPVDNLYVVMKEKFPEAFTSAGNTVRNTSQSISTFVQDGFGRAKDQVNNAMSVIKQAVTGSMTSSQAQVDTSTKSISDISTKRFKEVAQMTDQEWAQTKSFLSTSQSDMVYETNQKMEAVYKYMNTWNQSIYDRTAQVWKNITSKVTSQMAEIERAVNEASGNICKSFEDISATISKTFGSDLYAVGKQAMQSLQSGMNAKGLVLPHINWSWDRITYGDGGWFDIPRFNVKWYQNGGIPNAGDLFWMNENNRPELMYTKGNKTHIDSNTEIVNSLRNAIIDGMMEVAMATNGNQTGGTAPVIEFTWKTDSETLYKQTLRGRDKLQGRGFRVDASF